MATREARATGRRAQSAPEQEPDFNSIAETLKRAARELQDRDTLAERVGTLEAEVRRHQSRDARLHSALDELGAGLEGMIAGLSNILKNVRKLSRLVDSDSKKAQVILEKAKNLEVQVPKQPEESRTDAVSEDDKEAKPKEQLTFEEFEKRYSKTVGIAQRHESSRKTLYAYNNYLKAYNLAREHGYGDEATASLEGIIRTGPIALAELVQVNKSAALRYLIGFISLTGGLGYKEEEAQAAGMLFDLHSNLTLSGVDDPTKLRAGTAAISISEKYGIEDKDLKTVVMEVIRIRNDLAELREKQGRHKLATRHRDVIATLRQRYMIPEVE